MRKADYTLLAGLLAWELIEAKKQLNSAYAIAVVKTIAYTFADRASVDKAAFLKACGIDNP